MNNQVQMVAIQEKTKAMPKEVILEAGTTPSNGKLWVVYIMMLLEMFNAVYLKFTEFNQTTDQEPDDPVSRYLNKVKLQKEKEAEEKEQAPDKEEDGKDDGLEVLPTTVKLEPGVSSYSNMVVEPVLATGLFNGEDRAIHFLDPNSEKVETKEQRSQRMFLFDLLVRSIPSHQFLVALCTVGDFAKVFGLAKRMALQPDIPSLLQAITKMASLRKDPTTPWSQISTQIMDVQSSLRQVKPDSLKVGEQVLLQFVLQAMESDPRYALDLAMIRRAKPLPPLEHVMAEFTAKAAKIEGKGQPRGLTGLAAQEQEPAQQQEPALDAMMVGKWNSVKGAKKSKNVCFNFRKNGTCRFGDKCKFSHDSKATGGCAECDGPHDVSDCDARKRRLEGAVAEVNVALESKMSALEAKIAQMEALVPADSVLASIASFAPPGFAPLPGQQEA
jgi:hypothetical protein